MIVKKSIYNNDPMALIVFYNGLADKVIEWRNYKQSDKAPYWAYKSSLSEAEYAQLEIVWMYLVLCFGNYGISPRSGWIEDFEGFRKWIDEVEKLEVLL